MFDLVTNSKAKLRAILLLMGLLLTVSLSAQFGGGDGSEETPYLIARPQHLDQIRNFLGEDNANLHFLQDADIDLDVAPYNEGQGWSPIGSFSGGDHFFGTYDGNGYEISGMMIDHTVTYRGLFSSIQDATLKNIRLIEADVTASARSGIMVARAHDSRIVNCFVSGAYDGGTAQTHGGMIGECYDSEVINSGVDINMRCRGRQLGGLIGDAENSVIDGCYAYGTIASYNPGIIAPQQWGGLIGRALTTFIPAGDTEVSNSYSMVTIDMSAGNHSSIGGFIGSISNRTTVTNCYMAGRMIDVNRGGGFINSGNGTVVNSYWNTETSEFNQSDGGGEPRETIDMVYPYRGDRDVYVDWDFDEIWVHDEDEFNNGYPFLEHQVDPADLESPEVEVTIRVIEEEDYIIISWEEVEGAESYNVYMSDDLASDDWGEPVRRVAESPVQIEVGENRSNFFYVTSSSDPLP